MKHLFAFLIFLFSLSVGYSQSFVLLDSFTNVNVSNTIVTIPITANTQYKHKFRIQNTSSVGIKYQIERIILTNPTCAGTDVFFCAAGLCYIPDTVTSQFSGDDSIMANQILPAGVGTYGIDAHFDVGATCCSEDLMYKVFSINNPSDFVTVTLRYQCAIGINDIEAPVTGFLNTYPNPSNEWLFVKYNFNKPALNGKIVIHDVLGKVVKEIVLVGNHGEEKMNVSDFNSGVYFYSLLVDEKAIVTKKIIICAK